MPGRLGKRKDVIMLWLWATTAGGRGTWQPPSSLRPSLRQAEVFCQDPSSRGQGLIPVPRVEQTAAVFHLRNAEQGPQATSRGYVGTRMAAEGQGLSWLPFRLLLTIHGCQCASHPGTHLHEILPRDPEGRGPSLGTGRWVQAMGPNPIPPHVSPLTLLVTLCPQRACHYYCPH